MWQSKWALRLGVLSVVLLPLSVIGVRAGLWPFTLGFVLIACAAIIGLFTVVMVLVFVFRKALLAYRTHLTVAGLLGFSPVLLVIVLIGGASSKPMIHDVSTDWVNPPTFETLIAQRGSNANLLGIDDEVIALQQQHYPSIKPIISQLSVADANAKAVSSAQALGWQLVSNTGSVIEATYTSALFGFVDDIVIRVESAGFGSKVDVRSVSRVGKGDLGANAARIMAFVDVFNSEAGS